MAQTHKKLAVIFAEMFPEMKVKQYWAKGKPAIRIRLIEGVDVVFTYYTKDNWKLESMKMWENSVDGI